MTIQKKFYAFRDVAEWVRCGAPTGGDDEVLRQAWLDVFDEELPASGYDHDALVSRLLGA